MGIPAQSLNGRPPAAPAGRPGVALPIALFGLLAISVLASGIWAMTDLDARMASNRESASRALLLAESGAMHTVGVLRSIPGWVTLDALLRGADGQAGTADDGLLAGPGVDAAIAIPGGGIAAPGGRYTVRLLDDPADADGDPATDTNNRVIARCTGVADGGSSAVVDVVIAAPSLPAFLTNGGLQIQGNPDILGSCGGLHTNGDVSATGHITVSEGQTIRATGRFLGNGRILDPTGRRVEPQTGVEARSTPPRDAATYCAGADVDFILQADGRARRVRDGLTLDARSQERWGWRRTEASPVVWELASKNPEEGTFCVEGNARISGTFGNHGSPVEQSVIALGSIRVDGNGRFTPEHSQNILFLAAGDVELAGNMDVRHSAAAALIYAGSQCGFSGNMVIEGQIICADGPDPAGALDLFDLNHLHGNGKIRYDCAGVTSGNLRIVDWFQRFDVS